MDWRRRLSPLGLKSAVANVRNVTLPMHWFTASFAAGSSRDLRHERTEAPRTRTLDRTPAMAEFSTEAVTRDNWPDLEALFEKPWRTETLLVHGMAADGRSGRCQ